MKLLRQPALKWRIALMVLVAFIGLEGMVIITTAQEHPPRQGGRMMVSPEDFMEKETADIRKILVEIAQRASDQSMDQAVDLAFVIDGSVPMAEPVRMIEESVFDIAETFGNSGIDYQFGLIWYQKSRGQSEIAVKPLQSGLIRFGYIFRGNTAGYGLDAIMEGILELKFRLEAEKHLVLVTKSGLQTTWGKDQARKSEVQKILEWCKLFDIRINVIGINETVHKQLANATGGKWYEITKDRQKVNPAPQMDQSVKNRSANKIDEIFSGIAQHITATVKQPADIVFVFDASLSMDDKVRDICTGLDSLVKIFDSEGLDYRFGVIRFWAGTDGGKSTIRTTKPPLNIEQVKNLFRLRRHGDENLLDAIMEGVPKLQTPDGQKLVLVIITDELATRGPGAEYTYTQVIETCRDAGAQVNTIGAPRIGDALRIHDITDLSILVSEFMLNITEGTNGIPYIMPGTEEAWGNPRYQ